MPAGIYVGVVMRIRVVLTNAMPPLAGTVVVVGPAVVAGGLAVAFWENIAANALRLDRTVDSSTAQCAAEATTGGTAKEWKVGKCDYLDLLPGAPLKLPLLGWEFCRSWSCGRASQSVRAGERAGAVHPIFQQLASSCGRQLRS